MKQLPYSDACACPKKETGFIDFIGTSTLGYTRYASPGYLKQHGNSHFTDEATTVSLDTKTRRVFLNTDPVACNPLTVKKDRLQGNSYPGQPLAKPHVFTL